MIVNRPERNRPVRTARRRVASLAVATCIGLAIAAVLGTHGVAAPDVPHRTSIRDSPGWYPLVDPESMSVVLGRRLNAPRVHKVFRGGARSMADLGRAVCYALHHDSPDTLHALCITDDEFRDILWREFPESRPATGLQWQDAWTILYARIHSGCRSAVGDLGGRTYEFVRFEKDSTFAYRNFKLHRGLVLVARNDAGELVRMGWLRSVAERKGAFKIYSTDD
jgi:hypothetical protein